MHQPPTLHTTPRHAQAFEVSRLIAKLTRFTHDIFAFFVCSIYIYDGVTSVTQRFADIDTHHSGVSQDEREFGKAVFATIIAVGTFTIALWLNGARHWKAFNREIRNFLADYAVTIAVFLMSAFSFSFDNLPHLVTYVEVPADLGTWV